MAGQSPARMIPGTELTREQTCVLKIALKILFNQNELRLVSSDSSLRESDASGSLPASSGNIETAQRTSVRRLVTDCLASNPRIR